MSSENLSAGGDITVTQNVEVKLEAIKIRVTELIAILERRAARINKDMSKYLDKEVSEYLDQFNDLHQQHIQALQNENILLAHEILHEIHRLLLYLEKANIKSLDETFRVHLRYWRR